MNQTTLVVGAGPAGLAAAAELGRAGVPAVVLERGEAIGAAWRGRYDRLRLNTSRLTSRLPAARYRPGTEPVPDARRVRALPGGLRRAQRARRARRDPGRRGSTATRRLAGCDLGGRAGRGRT